VKIKTFGVNLLSEIRNAEVHYLCFLYRLCQKSCPNSHEW